MLSVFACRSYFVDFWNNTVFFVSNLVDDFFNAKVHYYCTQMLDFCIYL